MCAPMCAHEGVVGVGVMPIDVDLDTTTTSDADMNIRSNSTNEKLNRKETASNESRTTSSNAGMYQNKPFLNYYSLIEDEDDEDQYRNNAILQQRQLQSQNQLQPPR